VRRRLPIPGLLLALLLALAAPLANPPSLRAADAYKLATTVHYAVDPAARSIAVTVDVTFTNETPDPKGAFSVFETVPLAIHDVAASVAARDAKGALKVDVARNKQDVNVATVTLRDPLRYQKQATFSLTYQLPDGKDAAVRVRPSVVIFPVWSFGTSSQVTVDLPADYEVRADGDTLTASRDGDVTHLTSGPIADPTHWLALVSADRATAMVTASRSVPLSGGTVDLQVRSWADDAAWGDRTVDLLAGALPRLEKAIGLRYQRQGPLVVVEALPQVGGLGEPAPDAQDLQIAFDQPPFTVLHQAAHVWLGESFASDRWIREGLASHYAAIVARELKLALPYDPVKRATELKAAALPLADWPADATADQDSWAYAASWAEADRLAAAVGEDKLRLALQRVAAGQSAYDANPATPLVAPAASGGLVPAVDSRRLLDQLEITSDSSLTDEFTVNVFASDVADELAARTKARTAYAVLLAAAGDWGAPDPVRAAMAGWNFEDATKEMSAASTWLRDRDDLLRAVTAAGLSSPHQLQDRYRTSGGGADARDELNAERAVVTDYVSTLESVNASRGVVERIGLLGGQDPAAMLASANGLFADGNLRDAAEAISGARGRLEGAQVNGLLRLLSLLLLIVVVGAAIVFLVRRQRRVPLRRGSAAAADAPPERDLRGPAAD
jgi:hypothetical protein